MPQPWDIWWARWHHDDGSSKERFVLVLGPVEDEYLCSYISSQHHPGHPHLVLAEEHADFPATGLHVESYLYARDYQRIARDELLYRAGFLSDTWQKEFKKVWKDT